MKRYAKLFAVIMIIVSVSFAAMSCKSNKSSESSTDGQQNNITQTDPYDSVISKLTEDMKLMSDNMSGSMGEIDLGTIIDSLSFYAEGTPTDALEEEKVTVTCTDGMIAIESTDGSRSLLKLYSDGMLSISSMNGEIIEASISSFADMISSGGTATPSLDVMKLSFEKKDLVATDTEGVYTFTEEYMLEIAELMGLSADDLEEAEMTFSVDLRDYSVKGEFSITVSAEDMEEAMSIVMKTGGAKDGKMGIALTAGDSCVSIDATVTDARVDADVRIEASGTVTELELIMNKTEKDGCAEYTASAKAVSGENTVAFSALISEKGASVPGERAAELKLDVNMNGTAFGIECEVNTLKSEKNSSEYGISLKLKNGEESYELSAKVSAPCDKNIVLSDAEKIYVQRADAVYTNYDHTVKMLEEIKKNVKNAFKKDMTRMPAGVYTVDETSGVMFVSEITYVDSQYVITTRPELNTEYYSYFYTELKGNTLPKNAVSKAAADVMKLNSDAVSSIPEDFEYDVNSANFFVYKYIEENGYYIVFPFGRYQEAIWTYSEPTGETLDGMALHKYEEGKPLHNFTYNYDENCYPTAKCDDCGLEIYPKKYINSHDFGETYSHVENGETVWDHIACGRCGYTEIKMYDRNGIVQTFGLERLEKSCYSDVLTEISDYIVYDSLEGLYVIRDIFYEQNDDYNYSYDDYTVSVPNIEAETGKRIVGVVEHIRVKDGNVPYIVPSNTVLALPEGIEFLSKNALKKIRALTGVILPDSLIYIGKGAFAETTISEMVIPQNVRCLNFSFDIDSLVGLTVKAKHLPYLEIRSKNLRDLEINSTVETFGGIGSQYIKEFTVPDGVKEILEDAFANNDTIEKIVLSSTVEVISRNAFNDCAALKEIVLPNSLKQIGESAFENCDSLKTMWCLDGGELLGEVGLIRLPEALEKLGVMAFQYSGITAVEVFGECKEIGAYAFSSCSLETVFIHRGVEVLNGYAFSYTRIKSISLPESIREIGVAAFYDCKYLESVILSEGAECIREKAFVKCTALKKVSLPSTLSEVYGDIFDECGALEYSEYDKAKYVGNEKNPYVLLYTNTDKNMTYCEIHPQTRVIAEAAFQYCFNITRIIIPDSVVYIGANAFRGARNASEVTVGSGVGHIGEYGFIIDSDDALNEYENGLYIGNEGNPYMILVRVKDRTVTSFKTHPDTKIIMSHAFYSCKSLTDVTLNGKLLRISTQAFDLCEKLENIVISEGVEYLEISAFYDCKALVNVVLPKSLKVIEAKTFYGCTSLCEITYNGTVEEFKALVGDLNIITGYSLLTVHCSDGDIVVNMRL